MHDRTAKTIDPARRAPVRGPRRRCRPGVERLEGRALMSEAGGADLAFGTNGFRQLTTDFSVTPAASALQVDNKVVVVGARLVVSSSGAERQFIVSRYNADGTLDVGFGTGGSFTDPSLTVDIVTRDFFGIATGEAVAIQPDGKIVVAGEVRTTAKVIRLDADGTLDPSFGTGGIVTLGTQNDGTDRVGEAKGVAVLPGGQIAVAGVFFLQNLGAPAVQQLLANGSADPSFDAGNAALVPGPSGGTPVLAAQADGRLVVATSDVTSGVPPQTLTKIVATRFTTAGALDPSYGTGGQTVIAPQSILPGATSTTATTLAVQADGKVVIGGSILFGIPTGNALGPFPQILASRLDTNGRVDSSFGAGGYFIATGPGTASTSTGAEAIQPDGKIVLGASDYGLFIRLQPDGLPDAEFGTGGRSFLFPPPSDSGELNAVSLAIGGDGRIVATSSGENPGLIRLLGHGGINDFDDDGNSDPAVYDTATGQLVYFSTAAQAVKTVTFGPTGVGQSLPAPGAYDGGGVSEAALYLPALGAFAHLSPSFGPGPVTPFGIPGAGNSLPSPGDYDGSGLTEYAVYLPKYGEFAYRPGQGGNDVVVPFGTPGAGKSIPVPADYFGTGQDDIAVYLVAQGSYAIRDPATGQDSIIPFGLPGAGRSIPVPGDYDGSGHAELAVYLPDSAALIYRPAGGGPDVIERFGIPGAGMTLPAPGDYDGSGKTEVAAYLPTLGLFAYRPAGGGKDVVFPLGTAHRTIPFALASATDAASGPAGNGGGNAFTVRADSVEIPLTPDVLDLLEGRPTRKVAGHG